MAESSHHQILNCGIVPQGFIRAHPSTMLGSRSVFVLPRYTEWTLSRAYQVPSRSPKTLTTLRTDSTVSDDSHSHARYPAPLQWPANCRDDFVPTSALVAVTVRIIFIQGVIVMIVMSSSNPPSRTLNYPIHTAESLNPGR